MSTKNDVMTRSLSRRRFMGTSAGGFAAAVFAGGALPAGSGTAVMAQDGGTEFHAAWPYLDLGAGGHVNSFVTNGIMNPPNIYGDLMYVPMGLLYWADNTWLPLVAERWAFIESGVEAGAVADSSPAASPAAGSREAGEPDTLQVVLRQGVNWSDGNPVTSQDVKDTFDILRLQNNTAWDYLSGVEAIDDYTLNFYMSRPSTVVERYVVRMSPRPSAIYGEWAQQARELFDSGATNDDPEWAQLTEQFNQFRPEELIVNGPYTIDIASITNAQFEMPKNPDSYWSDQTAFNKIINFNGEGDTITPVVLSGDIDYATQGFAPATEQTMLEQGMRVLRPPTYAGASLKFNFGELTHFRDKRVRQAIAHAIDRDQAGFVSLADSGVGVQYMAGMSDNLLESWIDQDAVDSLNQYEYDVDKATALMEEAGWTRDGDWWTDPDGNEAAYDLIFPAEFVAFAATGANIAEQLTTFGFNMSPLAVTHTQVGPDVTEGRFQMVIQSWGSSSSPHPHYSYVSAFFTQNTRTGQPAERGMDFPLVQETDQFGEVDIDALVVATGEGMDIEAQRDDLTQAAQVFNELVNIVPIYERYGNNPALEGVRVQEWPADDDPILQNSPYADGIPTILMLTNGLQPVEGGGE